MKHFEFYPNIEYSNTPAKNILVRGKIRDAVIQKGSLYYKYTVEDGLRPEIIAHKYYGSPNYVWAIYYANNIFDPINDWVRTQREFDQFIVQKYGSVESAIRLYNTDGTRHWDSIHHFIEIDPTTKSTYIIDRKTFEKRELAGDKNVKAVTFYEHEKQLNESKRDIVVLDRSFLNGIVNELRNLFSES